MSDAHDRRRAKATVIASLPLQTQGLSLMRAGGRLFRRFEEKNGQIDKIDRQIDRWGRWLNEKEEKKEERSMKQGAEEDVIAKKVAVVVAAASLAHFFVIAVA